MKKEINFDVKALNGVINVIGKYGGDRSRLNDIQTKSLQSLIDGVSFKVVKKATRRSTVDGLTSEILKEMSIKGVRDPSTLKVVVSKIVEWELDSAKENFRMFLESNSFSLREEMNVSDLLNMLPARKVVRGMELKRFGVVYTVGSTSGYDIVECTEMALNEDLVEFYNDGELVAIYNIREFVRATLL